MFRKTKQVTYGAFFGYVTCTKTNSMITIKHTVDMYEFNYDSHLYMYEFNYD